METSEKVTLRVLYTVNTSPQYILAKALEKVPLIRANVASGSTSQLCYGRAPLKSCALAICRSSPELRPDMTKDFSVYVLDPLEEFLSKGGQSQPSGGVAVGMGPLSSIVSPLSRDESLVVGAIVECGMGETALEVVISLRQLAPSLASFGALTYSQPPDAKRTKPTTDEPFFTSKPLPSLDEQILRVQERKKTEESRKYAAPPRPPPRKENPSHSTRAHTMPTPYIGPPRRKYEWNNTSDSEASRDGSEPARSQSTNHGSIPSSQESTEPSVSTSLTSTLAQTTTSAVPSELSSMSDSAILLAALSCVNGKEGNVENSAEQANSSPNPNLVAFLRAYLASLEKPQNQPITQSNDSSNILVLNHTAGTSTAASLGNARDTTASVSPRRASQLQSVDKENQRPPSPQKNDQVQKPLQKSDPPKTNTSPLAPARFNSLLARKNTPASTSSDPAMPFPCSSSSSGQQRKRKLSEVLSGSNGESTPENRSKPPSRRPPRIEDENGVPINTGWGGLRMRADGTFSGGHLAKPPATAPAPTQPRPLFRSTSLASAPIRKGPYVVPDWAKGVPPPVPPTRNESDADEKEQEAKKKKKSKTKGLERLGGQRSVKRSISSSATSDPLDEQLQDMPPSTSSQDPPSTPKRSQTSPKRLTPGMPIFAQSSPLARGSFGAFFRAFQTSPVRSNAETGVLPSTPKSSRRNCQSGSEEPENVISLFTPSPAPANNRSTRSRSVLADPPASPTPSRRRARSISLLESPTRSKDCNDLSSSLPIASSDDDVMQPSTSSDSTIMNTSTSIMHDWSSLDLPPSSPPPPSSPTLAPMDNSDLPCSDIPSPELCEVTTPSSSATPAEDCSTPYNEPEQQQTNAVVPIASPEGVVDMSGFSNIFADPAFADFLQQISGQTDLTAVSSTDALQNGLAQEDLSETWNVLSDIVTNAAVASSTETQVQDWLTAATNDAEGQNFGKLMDDNIFLNSNGLDQSNQLALNFEDLFQGCLV